MPGDREGIHRRLRPRGGAESDEGFVLLESIIAIALITVLMVGLTSLFISAMQSTAHQRATQGAVRIATDQIDQIRGLGYNGALSGRDQSSVQSQFAAARGTVLTWLSTRDDQAFADGATTDQGRVACGGDGPSGPCAALPTTPVERNLNNVTFSVNYYEEWCYRDAADKTTADCLPGGQRDSGTRYNQYLRVVVDIVWTDSSCPADGCSYLSSILLNGTAEPTFYFNDQPPPKPDITGCTPPAVAVGDRFSSEDPAHPALRVVGTDGFCGFEGGVPTFTWSALGLPDGLAMQADGSIIGEPTTAGTVTGITLTATDAFLIEDTSPTFSWKVYPRLALTRIPDHTDTQGQQIAGFTASASGGQGSPYTYTATGLPPGTKLSSAGTFSGTPTTVGSYRVTVTVTDASAARSVSGTFTWTVTYPPLSAASPATQVSTAGAPVDAVTLSAAGGSGNYEYSDPDFTLPTGLTLTGDRITGTPTGAGNYSVMLTVTDATAGLKTTLAFSWNVNPSPSVLPPPNTTTAPGGAVKGQAVGSDGTPDYTFALENAPSWMVINPATGELTGTASDEIADYPGIVIKLTDSKGAVAWSAPFTWSVYQIPTLVPPGDQTTGFGEHAFLQLQYTCTATPCWVTATNLPDWTTLDPELGTIGGDAPDTQRFYDGITVSVTDARGSVASSQFNWVVGPRQTITSPGDQVWTKGQPLTNDSTDGLQMTAKCTAEPCTFSFVDDQGHPVDASPLPAGLTMHADGLITGTPTGKGTWADIVVRVTNKNNATATAAPFTWTINDPPTLAKIDNQRNKLNDSVSIPLSGDCRSDPCQYTYTSLPAGLSISEAGVMQGRPSTPGVSDVTVYLTDKTGATTSRSVRWYVVSFVVPAQRTKLVSIFGQCWWGSTDSVMLADSSILQGAGKDASIAFSLTERPSWVSLDGTQLVGSPGCRDTSGWVTVRLTASGDGAPTLTIDSRFFWTVSK